MKKVPSELKYKLAKLKKALRYLGNLSNPGVGIQENRLGFESLYFTWDILNNGNFTLENKQWKFLSKYKLATTLSKILHYAGNLTVKDFDDFCSNELESSKNTFNNEIKENEHSILFYTVFICKKLSSLQFYDNDLYSFSKSMIDMEIFKQLIKLLGFNVFQNLAKNNNEQKHVYSLLDGLLKTILSLSESPYIPKNSSNQIEYQRYLEEFSNNSTESDIKDYLNKIFFNLNQKSLAECLDFLNKFNEASEIANSEQAYKDFLYMSKIVGRNVFDENRLFSKYNCKILFTKIFTYYLTILKELDFANAIIKYDYPVQNADLNERQTSILLYVLITLSSLIFKSIELNLYFGKKSLVKSLLSFLEDIDFVLSIPVSKNEFLLAVITNIYLLSQMADDEKNDWMELNAMEILINTSRHMLNSENQANFDKIIDRIYSTIAILADDKQIERLPEIESVVGKLLAGLVQISNKIEENKFIEKVNIEFFNDDNQIEKYEVSFVNASVTSILDLLKRFSVNDKMRKTIYEKHYSIKTLILNGNEIEKLYALKLLAQLSFNDDIAKDLSTDSALIDYLKDLGLYQPNKNLKRVSENIIWTINHKSKEPEIIENLTKRKALHETEREHIMISYNSSTRALCLKIKNELEKSGYKVWIDVESISGSSIDSMARAVEQSFCVLMCVCEKYRLSENCQAEAQYAFRLRKPIIPLIMQEGYENVEGWLGFIIGDKIFVNFTKYEFEKCMENLQKEVASIYEKTGLELLNQVADSLRLRTSESAHSNSNIMIESVRIEDTYENPENWDNQRVKKWLEDNKIHPAIIESYKEIDGEILKQLYEMEKKSPEFFYQTIMIETKNEIKTADLALFLSRLKKLFD